MAIFRQGDVLIRSIDGAALPADAKPEPRDGRGRLILAAGEVTGHHHAVADRTATLLPWVLADGTPSEVRARSRLFEELEQAGSG